MMTKTEITALDYLNQRVNGGLIVHYVSLGAPAGSDVAYHPEYWDVPISDLSDLTGTIVDGEWRWDGNGNPLDCASNSVTHLVIYPDREEWDRQCAEYLESEC